MERGAAVRATGATKLNEISSRSHAIFMLIVEKSTPLGEEEGGGRGGEEPYGAGRAGPPSSRGEARQSVKVGGAGGHVITRGQGRVCKLRSGAGKGRRAGSKPKRLPARPASASASSCFSLRTCAF